MNATDTLIDRDLNELLGGETPPDLIAQTLARLERGDVFPQPTTEAHQPAPAGRLIMLRRLATAACVALAVGLITWVLWPQPLPETVTASAGANYLVRDDHIQLNQGWLLLTDGAPQVRTDSGRVSVTGRAVVGPAIPGDDALDVLADQLGLSAEERVMFKMKERWLTAASLAICLFSGQAMFNGDVVIAENLPKPEIKVEKVDLPDPDDLEGLRALIRSATAVRVRAYVDDSDQWSGTLKVKDAAPVLDAIAEGLGDRLKGEPENEIENYIELQLSSDAVMSCTLDANGNLFRISGPGWESDEWYSIDATASAKISEWIERAKITPAESESFRVKRKWEGADSEITDARCEVIADKDTWSALWMAHTINFADDPVDPPKLPEVDFEKELVVAVFGGAGFNSKGFFVHEILATDTGWVVRVDETTYQTRNGADEVTPYGIWVLPNDGGTIVVEENVQNLLGQSPAWKPIGGRLLMDSNPEAVAPWRISFRSTGVAKEFGTTMLIENLRHWNNALASIGGDSEAWGTPDFGKQVAFVTFGYRDPAKGGEMRLEIHGVSSGRAVLRLTRVIHEGGLVDQEKIFGLWVLPRIEKDITIEEVRTPGQWREEGTFKASERRFGVHAAYWSPAGDQDASVTLVTSRKDLDEILDGVESRRRHQPDWVNWETESVVVIFTGGLRVREGVTVTSKDDYREHVLTYHLTTPSGVDPGLRGQYAVVKVLKPTKTLIINQSIDGGPAPADVKEVARFEK